MTPRASNLVHLIRPCELQLLSLLGTCSYPLLLQCPRYGSLLDIPCDSSCDGLSHINVLAIDPLWHRLYRMRISSHHKPMSYIHSAKRLLHEHGELHLSALGAAIGPMVTLAEVLKSRQLAVVTKLHTSLEHVTADERCFKLTLRPVSQ